MLFHLLLILAVCFCFAFGWIGFPTAVVTLLAFIAIDTLALNYRTPNRRRQ